MKKESTHRKIEHSPETKARHKAIRNELRKHPSPEELVASGDYSKPIAQGVVLDVLAILSKLKAVREKTSLTLGELADRSGIDKPSLSRMETGKNDNPTIQTLLRYVHGLGKRLVVLIEDEPDQNTIAETQGTSLRTNLRRVTKV